MEISTPLKISKEELLIVVMLPQKRRDQEVEVSEIRI
jgi:hypothetical protein